jgi:PleD family two-component response regulator
MFLLKKIRENRSYVSFAKRKNNIAFSEKDFRFILNLEKERADRGNHQFSIIIFDKKQFENENGVVQHLIDNIIQRVRDIDIVGWLNSESICVLLPYTSTAGAKQLVGDLCESLNSSIPKSSYSVRTYPL